jgi:broad specificity phosphatase PhoE
MEIGCGVVDGLHVEEVRARHPDAWQRNERQDDDDFRWPGGESYRELRSRCVDTVDRIAARHAGGRVAIVTHAGVIAQVLGRIAGQRPARWARFRPANASLTELEVDAGAARIVSFDDVRHLAPRPAAAARASSPSP